MPASSSPFLHLLPTRRAAEEVLLGSVSQGSSNDLEKATGLAVAMVTQFGFGKKTGLLSLGGYSSASQQTQRVAEEEVQEILKEEYQRALGIVKRRKGDVQRLAELLLEKEVIHEGSIQEILGEREKAIAEENRRSGSDLFRLALSASTP